MLIEKLRSRLLAMLSKRNLFEAQYAAEMAGIIQTADLPTLLLAAKAMGAAVAFQANAVADALEKMGGRVEAGRLRSQARLANADWRPYETEDA